MSVTYFVALPFVETDEGMLAAGQAQECQSESSAIKRAEALAAKPEHIGALAFKRSGDPGQGQFADATILKTFGIVPDHLEEF
jgi:hypothetical protein